MATELEQIIAALDSIEQHVINIADTIRITGSQVVVSEGLSDISERLGLVQAGEFRTGNGLTPGDGFSGIRIGYPSFTYSGEDWHLAGVNNDVLQVGIRASDGTLLAGGGSVILDADGVLFSTFQGSYSTANSVTWNSTASLSSYYEIFAAAPYFWGTAYLNLFSNLNRDWDSSQLYLKARTGNGSDAEDVGIALVAEDSSQSGQSSIIMLNYDGYDVDTQIRGLTDNNLIYVNAGTNRVGIGTSSPLNKVHISGGHILLDNTYAYRMKTSGGSSVAAMVLNASDGFSIGNSSFVNTTFYTGSSFIFRPNGSGTDLNALGIYPTSIVINDGAYNYNVRMEGQTDPNLFQLAASLDKIGIGIGTPAEKLHVSGGYILVDNTYGLRAKTSGGVATDIIYLNSSNNTVMPLGANLLSITATSTTVLGQFINSGNGDGFRVMLGDGVSNLTTGNDFMIFYDNVGPTTVGSIDSDGAGGTRFNVSSDIRLKSDIRPMEDALSRVMKLRPSRFMMGGKHKEGLIAQWTEDVYPQAVTVPKIDKNEYYMIDYIQFVPLLIGAVQELSEKLYELERRIK